MSFFFFQIRWQTLAVLWGAWSVRFHFSFLSLSHIFWDFLSCLGFFLIQTFCLFLGPVSHHHHLTPSSLLTTCHMDRCSTYSTKALVSRFTFMYSSEPTFTLLIIPTFQFCPVPLFGARTKNPLRSNYDLYCNWPVEDTFFPSLCKFLWNHGHFNGKIFRWKSGISLCKCMT